MAKSVFQNNMRSDFDDVVLNEEEVAEEVNFTPYGGSAKDITVVWDDTGIQERWIKNNLRSVGTAIVEISKTDRAIPDTRDKFTRDSAVWAVFMIQGHDITSTTMEVITFDKRFIGGKNIKGDN